MYEYYIEVPSLENNKVIRDKICQKAFLNFFDLKRSEIRTKIQLDRDNSSDNRGKHKRRYFLFFSVLYLREILL
jgi:hypothetical protein